MIRRCLRLAIAAVAAMTVAPAAYGAPCSGFTDVDDASAFCPNVDWLKNRSITLGCGAVTTYCPTDSVIRLSMAAFMNRLGTAMTPDILYDDASGGALALDAPPPTLCETAPFVVNGYLRSAQLGATLTAQIGATTAGFDLTLMQSTDGGASWTPLNAIPASVAGTSKRVNTSVWKGEVPLAIGVTYRFGLRVTRTVGAGTTGDLLAWNCQLKGVLTSRTGTSAPF